MMANGRIFLTAEWRYLAMLNFRVDADIVQEYVPSGTELDTFDGAAHISLVGFVFQNTRILGFSIPGHSDFEELNLRVYVRRVVNGEVRRGVTFIRDVVPRRAIAAVARKLYNEPYDTVPMRHKIERGHGKISAEYSWKFNGRWNRLVVNGMGSVQPIQENSHDEYISEHYW